MDVLGKNFRTDEVWLDPQHDIGVRKSEYKFTWRLWDSEPSAEDRDANPWLELPPDISPAVLLTPQQATQCPLPMWMETWSSDSDEDLWRVTYIGRDDAAYHFLYGYRSYYVADRVIDTGDWRLWLGKPTAKQRKETP